MKKKYTITELMKLYWEFRKKLITRTETFGSYTGSGCGGSSTYQDYTDTAQDFLLWLEEGR